MAKVVLIDTGLTDNYKDSRIVGGCSVVPSSEGYKIQNDYTDLIGHGTAAAHIILKNSSCVELFILRIYEESLFIDVEKLIFAIEYAKKHLEYDIIQISSGLLTYSADMHRLIKSITEEDKLVISAFDNEGGMSYPAAFPEVLGIDLDSSYRKKEEFDISEDGLVDVRGSSAYFRVPWINDKKNIVNGTSFLTSYYTAWIGDNCSDNLNKKHVLEQLKNKAIHVYGINEYGKEISSKEFVKDIKKAIAFPFNKEIYCLAAFEDMLPFDIVGYYDIKHKFLVGKKISEVLSYTQNESVISNVDSIDWNGDFDTVIIGHLSEISSVTQKNYLFEMMELCKTHHKKAYIFDDLSLVFQNYCNNSAFFSPVISKSKYTFNHFGKLRVCNIPVLAVLGTSSRQGKYSIQLSLFNELKKRDIKVDGISTEPTGALFGYSEMFPYGYGSNNSLSGQEIIKTLNEMVFRLECAENEIILTGGQSGTIAYDLRNEYLIPYEQYPFLLGINPDGVILCINEKDDVLYVKKTISYIEAITSARVFAIVISSVRNNKDEETHSESIKLLKDTYKDKSFYDLHSLDIKALTDDIIRYYD